MPNSFTRFLTKIPKFIKQLFNIKSSSTNPIFSELPKHSKCHTVIDITNYQPDYYVKDVTNVYFKPSKHQFHTSIYESADYYAKTTFLSVTGQVWAFELDLISFEVFNGLSRICGIIPDKLETAIAINQEFLPNNADDGTFLVTLVEDLLSFYIKLFEGKQQRKLYALMIPLLHLTFSEPAEAHIEYPKGHTAISFEQLILQLRNLIIVFKLHLSARNLPLLKANATFIKAIATDLFTFWRYYEKTLHPMILTLSREARKKSLEISKFENKKLNTGSN